MTKSLIVCLAVSAAVGMSSARLPAGEVKGAAGSPASIDLPKMLEALGYEPREVSIPSGEKSYEITTTRAGREVAVVLGLTADGRHLTVTAPLREQGAPKREAAESYLKLLAFNYSHGLNVFGIHGDRLVLSRKLETAGLAPAAVRKAIDLLDGDVRASTADWNVPALDPANGPTTAAAGVSSNGMAGGGMMHLRPSPF